MIKAIRDQLIHDHKTGSDEAVTPTPHPIHPPYPLRVVPPCFVVGMMPGPYVTGGQVFQSFEVLMTVIVLVPKSDTYLDDLETMVEYVLSNTVDWGLRGVDTPSAFNESGMEMLGTTIVLAKQAK